jgi:hypothetical protein
MIKSEALTTIILLLSACAISTSPTKIGGVNNLNKEEN